MSSNLMETEAGGEQTQYEGAHTHQNPPKKSTGQLGDAASATADASARESDTATAERGQKTAENVRYGQTISESGMGGFTKGHCGDAERERFGRVEESGAEEAVGAEQARQAAGYGGDNDMDREVGA